MIDWNTTMYVYFDGTITLKDNGQLRKTLCRSDYGALKNVNWYLKRIKENPDYDF